MPDSLHLPAISPVRLARVPVLILTSLVCVSVCVSGGCREQRTKDQALQNMPPEMTRLLDPMQSTPLVIEGIDQPGFVSADEANLDPDAEVIGVVVEGQPRAYPLSRMSGMLQHVVNDHVTGPSGDPKPFTVTYCDMTDCIRVLQRADGVLQGADDRASTGLGVGTLGLLDGGLALRWEGKQFKQTAEIAGLADLPHERTIWQAWRAEHPDTRVYVGPQRTGAGESASAPEIEQATGERVSGERASGERVSGERETPAL